MNIATGTGCICIYGEDWCQIKLLISSPQSLHQNQKSLNVFELFSAWRTMRLLFLLWHQGSATAETAPGTTAGQDQAVVWLQSRFFYLKRQVNFTYQCKENWCCHLKIDPSFHFRSLGMAMREKLEMEGRHWWSKWKWTSVPDAWECEEDSLCSIKCFETCEAWWFTHQRRTGHWIFWVKQLLREMETETKTETSSAFSSVVPNVSSLLGAQHEFTHQDEVFLILFSSLCKVGSWVVTHKRLATWPSKLYTN